MGFDIKRLSAFSVQMLLEIHLQDMQTNPVFILDVWSQEKSFLNSWVGQKFESVTKGLESEQLY